VDLKAGGEISESKIGMTPHALTKQNRQNQTLLDTKLCDLPLNAELDAESTSCELAECAREDPEWNECSDEKDEDAKKKEPG
jgi:hypothetical protein